MSPLQKTTFVYAIHNIPLHCDVYEAAGYPVDAPVFLFFHAGGLVGGDRRFVPPWLQQLCYRNKWPLMSASYRLLPQVNGSGLLEDVKAAYKFAGQLGDSKRHLIVGGASAGAFMAAVAIHHLQPPPLALFSISGILTFQHPFFNSSIKLDQNLAQADITPYLSGAVTVGYNPAYDEWAFDPEMLTPSSSMRNHNYVRPTKPATMSSTDARSYQRRKLYEFFVNKNMYVEMVEGVDLGFDWATERHNKWNDWPPTIIVQGDNDDDVNKDVAIYVAKLLGEKAKLFLAERKGHMFEATAFLDDEVEGLDVVRRAARELENVIERSNYPGLV